MTEQPAVMTLAEFGANWIPKVEANMRALTQTSAPAVDGMYAMMRYHLGWEDQHGRPDQAPQGKRVRPLLVLISCLTAGGAPASALPAATAVELLHNFSLIHDDIEDRSPTRRHRPTLFSWAGEPQAINTGDAMFTLAHIALHGLSDAGASAATVLEARRVFDATCLRLTEGQYLDMDFEIRRHVSVDDYLMMIAGKTAALLAACAQLGAIVAGAAPQPYRRFGHELGLSFQVQDDILGIWGDEAHTGKSASSDLLTRKKTLPVLFALSQPGAEGEALRAFYARERDIVPEELPDILELLNRLGAREHAAAAARSHAEAALQALEQAHGTPEGTALLAELAHKLLGRQT